MFKKVLLTLCLSAFLSWAQDDFDEDDEGFISAPAAAQEGGLNAKSLKKNSAWTNMQTLNAVVTGSATV